MNNSFHVYILTNASRTLYTGVTNNLLRQYTEHKEKQVPGFTARYNVDQLVHYELFATPGEAIAREKQIKGWSRAKKVALIERENPHWQDLGPGLRWGA